MEDLANIPPEAATDEPASPETLPALCGARVSEALPTRFAEALEAAVQPRPGPAPRSDGWTPERIRLFLVKLSECGVATDAARAAGMSFQSAYNFRNRAGGRAFHLAWEAAVQMGRRRLADEMVSRAMHGCVELIVRDGKVWGERHRFDNRLSMSVLARLDDKAQRSDRENETIRLVTEEFDQFVDIVCAGDQDAAADFLDNRQSVRFGGESELIDRLENYRRYGVGHHEEIDTSDLDPERQESWSAEDRERAERAGLVAPPDEEEDEDDEAASEWHEDKEHCLVVPEGTRVRNDGTVLLPDGQELAWSHWLWVPVGEAENEAEEVDDDEVEEDAGPCSEES